MGYAITLILSAIGAAVIGFLSDELREALVWLRKRAIRSALERLPLEARQRYAEEWEADLADKPGEIARCIWAWGCYCSAAELGQLSRQGHTATFSVSFNKRMAQRAFDVTTTWTLVALLFPLFFLLGFLVRREHGLSIQRTEIIGRGGRAFSMLAYPTTKPAACGGEAPTNIGHWLSRSGLDGLPILINIIMGHMAIVGPCPRTRHTVESMRDDHRRIYLSLKPGLVSPRVLLKWPFDPTAENFEFEYLRTRTWRSDFALLWQSGWQMFFYGVGHSSIYR